MEYSETVIRNPVTQKEKPCAATPSEAHSEVVSDYSCSWRRDTTAQSAPGHLPHLSGRKKNIEYGRNATCVQHRE